MKKRNLVIVAFMLVAAMTIGVGYAALTGTLTLSGNAQYDKDASDNAFEEDLVFTNAEQTGFGSAYTAGTLEDSCSASEQSATFSVKTLATVNDEAVFVYTITNNNNVAATLAVNANNEDGTANPDVMESFDVDWVLSSNTIAAGDTVTLTVTVTLKQQPTTTISLEQYVLNITATSAS